MDLSVNYDILNQVLVEEECICGMIKLMQKVSAKLSDQKRDQIVSNLLDNS